MAIRLDDRPVSTPADMLTAARGRFLRGERLDIAGLAEELGISRATAYRWAGNVGELTDFVIATLAAETFERSFKRAKGEGAERLIDAYRHGIRLMASGSYREWLKREDPDTALRIVASRFGRAQATSIRLWEGVLEEEMCAGRLDLPVDAHTMAYAIVRLSESFLYADLIAGEEPDVEKAVEILKLLLR